MSSLAATKANQLFIAIFVLCSASLLDSWDNDVSSSEVFCLSAFQISDEFTAKCNFRRLKAMIVSAISVKCFREKIVKKKEKKSTVTLT